MSSRKKWGLEPAGKVDMRVMEGARIHSKVNICKEHFFPGCLWGDHPGQAMCPRSVPAAVLSRRSFLDRHGI